MGPQTHSIPATLDASSKRLNSAVPLHNYGLHSKTYESHSSHPILDMSDQRAPTLNRDIGSRFGQRLRSLRQERSLTQSQMAKKFGIDRSFISDVERGRKSISLGLLEVVALGLKVSLSELFKDL